MALHFYLAMWLEANTGKLNSNECKMFHSIYEKLCKAVETLKVQVRVLKKENEELAEKLKQEKLAVSGKTSLRGDYFFLLPCSFMFVCKFMIRN